MGKNIKINEHLLNANHIAVGKNSPIVSLAVVALGGLLFVVAMMVGSRSGAYTALLFIGFLLLVAGVSMFFLRKAVYKYLPTGELLQESTMYFDSAQKGDVESALENGDFNRLRFLSSGNSTLPLMLEFYCSKSGSCAMYQMYRYVPHYYEPLGEMQFYVR